MSKRHLYSSELKPDDWDGLFSDPDLSRNVIIHAGRRPGTHDVMAIAWTRPRASDSPTNPPTLVHVTGTTDRNGETVYRKKRNCCVEYVVDEVLSNHFPRYDRNGDYLYESVISRMMQRGAYLANDVVTERYAQAETRRLRGLEAGVDADVDAPQRSDVRDYESAHSSSSYRITDKELRRIQRRDRSASTRDSHEEQHIVNQGGHLTLNLKPDGRMTLRKGDDGSFLSGWSDSTSLSSGRSSSARSSASSASSVSSASSHSSRASTYRRMPLICKDSPFQSYNARGRDLYIGGHGPGPRVRVVPESEAVESSPSSASSSSSMDENSERLRRVVQDAREIMRSKMLNATDDFGHARERHAHDERRRDDRAQQPSREQAHRSAASDARERVYALRPKPRDEHVATVERDKKGRMVLTLQ